MEQDGDVNTGWKWSLRVSAREVAKALGLAKSVKVKQGSREASSEGRESITPMGDRNCKMGGITVIENIPCISPNSGVLSLLSIGSLGR